MAICVLVEVLLPGGSGVEGGGGTPPPKDEAGEKECIRNKLKVLVRLPGRLCVKAAEPLLGIIGVILNWILIKLQTSLVGYPKIYGHWS